MHFTSFILAATLFASSVLAYNPIGQSCPAKEQGAYGCSQDAGVNGRNAFIYECGPANKFVYVAGCRCPSCCSATTGGAFCT
ncbi:hypothetical protein SISNIDRAFT_506467 [Sistotremastrum niveocremeum HHB9708]|uniref:Uncharacterized protein n=1 Tax=Sistotremastrum niveocremeum HHB9708 TaxID=1314777 RepID=A0A164V528_9AGAM|nr:hypothetical protein SISNIDRAFT_506467 [Sistotremastrum niveocremeum HHB9708]